MITRTPLRIVVLSLLTTAACERIGSEPWSGQIETLPSGRTRVTNPEQGLWANGKPWRLVQDLAIGAVDGADAEVFAQVSGLEVDDAGRIYVLDRQANELRIFAADGSHVRTVGRSGFGPGEYRTANGLLWIAPDSLLVIDQQGERYSVLTSDGAYVRSVTRSLGFFGWIATAAHHEGRIYEMSSVRQQSEPRPALLGTSLQSSPENLAGPDAPFSEKGIGAILPYRDTVLLPKSNQPAPAPFVVQNERAMRVMSVPFAARTIYHVDAAGNVWHGHGSEFRIFRSTMAGDTTLEIAVAATPAAVTPEELQEWEAGDGVKQLREMGGKIDLGRIPATKPYFERLYADPEGYLWVLVPSAPGRTVFVILDANGRYLGRLEIPGIRADALVPPVVRNGRLYLSGRDDLGVPRVFRFTITDRD